MRGGSLAVRLAACALLLSAIVVSNVQSAIVGATLLIVQAIDDLRLATVSRHTTSSAESR